MNDISAPTTSKPIARSWRPWRFSLLTMMLVTAVVCLGVSHFHTTRQLHQANQELRQLRTEVGSLTIDDSTQVYAVAIPCNEPLTWKWRVYLPPGNWDMHTAHGEIPTTGFNPRASGTDGSAKGGKDFTIEAFVRKGARGVWEFRMVSPHTGFMTVLTDEDGRKWLDSAGMLPLPFGDRTAKQFDPTKGPMQIARVRVPSDNITSRPVGAPQESPPTSLGFLVWFERAP